MNMIYSEQKGCCF